MTRRIVCWSIPDVPWQQLATVGNSWQQLATDRRSNNYSGFVELIRDAGVNTLPNTQPKSVKGTLQFCLISRMFWSEIGCLTLPLLTVL